MAEWFALPLIEEAASKQIDTIFNDIFHPIAIQIVERCDAVLRIGGPSAGADKMVSVGKAYGKIIYLNKGDIPMVSNSG